HAGPQASDDAQEVSNAAGTAGKGRWEYAPYAAGCEHLEAVRHHTNDRERFAVDPDPAPQDARVAPEPGPPNVFAQHKSVRVQMIVGGQKRPSSDGSHAEHFEETDADHLHRDLLA